MALRDSDKEVKKGKQHAKFQLRVQLSFFTRTIFLSTTRNKIRSDTSSVFVSSVTDGKDIVSFSCTCRGGALRSKKSVALRIDMRVERIRNCCSSRYLFAANVSLSFNFSPFHFEEFVQQPQNLPSFLQYMNRCRRGRFWCRGSPWPAPCCLGSAAWPPQARDCPGHSSLSSSIWPVAAAHGQPMVGRRG